MAEGKTNMFGKTYNTIGSTDSNFIIKTKGDLKVQWGNKYIDVIKNGKIASENSKLLFIVSSPEEIDSNGIYIVQSTEGNEVWLNIDGNKINITNNSDGAAYVSFLVEQEATSDQKHQALTNIGFYYETLQKAQLANITSGIIYVEKDNKLYIAKDGLLTEYIINNSSINSSSGEETSTEEEQQPLYIEQYYIRTSKTAYIECSGEVTHLLTPVHVHDMLQSDGADYSKGYRLYIDDKGYSVLEIDYIKWRKYPIPITYSELISNMEKKTLSPKMFYLITDFQNPWEVTWGSESVYYENKYAEINGVKHLCGVRNMMKLIVQAKNEELLEEQAWSPLNPDWIMHYDPYFKGTEHLGEEDTQYGFRSKTNDDGTITYLPCKGQITYLKDELGNEGNFNFRQFMFKHNGYYRYCMDSITDTNTILGEFFEGKNNKFILGSIDAYVQLFEFEAITDTSGNTTGYTMTNIDPDIQLSSGHHLFIQANTVNDNSFDLEKIENTIYHKLTDIERNNFIRIGKEITSEYSTKNNSFEDINGSLTINISCENNILKQFNSDVIIQGNSFNGNILINFTNNIQNEGSFVGNTIKECTGQIVNTGVFENNNIDKIVSLTNDYSIQNNTIKTIENNTIAANILQNTIQELKQCTINANISENIFENITNVIFNGVTQYNKFYADITDSTLAIFTNNLIYKNISNLNSSENIDSCIFNYPISDLTAANLNSCTFEHINGLVLDQPVYYTTFHGHIGNLTKQLTDLDWELLSDPSKKTEAYPNIRVVHVPEIILKGMILMWYGQEEIPKGWALCDGTKGTPNLIDRFIKASDTVEEVNPDNVNENNEITLKAENLPEHHHPHKKHYHYFEGSDTDTITDNYASYNNSYSVSEGEGDPTTSGENWSAHSETETISINISGYTSSKISEEDTWQYGDEPEPIKLEPRHYKLIFIMKIDGDEQ